MVAFLHGPSDCLKDFPQKGDHVLTNGKKLLLAAAIGVLAAVRVVGLRCRDAVENAAKQQLRPTNKIFRVFRVFRG